LIYQVRTFKDVQDEVIDFAKLENSNDVRTSLKRKINTVYQEVCLDKPYNWSGETRPLLLKGRYDTGTISIDQDSETVTGISTVFSELDHRFCKIRIAGSGTPFTIRRVGSSTSLTLDSPWQEDDVVGGSYYIYKDEYGLFPDCHAIRSMWIPGLIKARQPIFCGPREMDEYRAQSPFRSGTPTFYTINGKSHFRGCTWGTFKIGFDFWEGSLDDPPEQRRLIVWPASGNENKTAMVRYTKIPPLMAEDTDEPLIPRDFRMVLVWGTLLKNFLRNRDIATKREWQMEYNGLRTKMAGDIETTDDELRLYVDKTSFRREYSGFAEDYFWESQ
jgi:hypothetical protein